MGCPVVIQHKFQVYPSVAYGVASPPSRTGEASPPKGRVCGVLLGVLVDALAKGQQLPLLLETLQCGRLRRLRPNLITVTAALGACGHDSVGGKWGKGQGETEAVWVTLKCRRTMKKWPCLIV